jgi:hypothetical protein
MRTMSPVVFLAVLFAVSASTLFAAEPIALQYDRLGPLAMLRETPEAVQFAAENGGNNVANCLAAVYDARKVYLSAETSGSLVYPLFLDTSRSCSGSAARAILAAAVRPPAAEPVKKPSVPATPVSLHSAQVSPQSTETTASDEKLVKALTTLASLSNQLDEAVTENGRMQGELAVANIQIVELKRKEEPGVPVWLLTSAFFLAVFTAILGTYFYMEYLYYKPELDRMAGNHDCAFNEVFTLLRIQGNLARELTQLRDSPEALRERLWELEGGASSRRGRVLFTFPSSRAGAAGPIQIPVPPPPLASAVSTSGPPPK